MDTVGNSKNIDVVILCGGLGTRISDIFPDTPKTLLKFKKNTFLDILIEELNSFGFKNFILAVGHLKEKIKNHKFNSSKNLKIHFSQENIPLGTGGALKNAEKFLKADVVLVINGDSFCKVDYLDLINFHIDKKSLITVVLSKKTRRKDGGNVVLGENEKISRFSEKKGKGLLINAGIYLMNKEVFKLMPGGKKFSLEYDFFPKILKKGCFGYRVDADLIDIGTPQRYKKAQRLL